MARENFSNFATTALVGSTLTSGGLTFSCTATQGALFPLTNFLVTIDGEILLIASRIADAFTIGTRGYDGTTAASHSVAAVIQLTQCAYNMTHLWQNVADSYTPDVPPVQLPGGNPGTYDNEFEAAAGWTLYPSPASGTIWTLNSTLRSQIVLHRTTNDNTLYVAYQTFLPVTAFTVTTKISASMNAFAMLHNDTVQVQFFVSDQTNPTASPNAGTQFQVQLVDWMNTTTVFTTANVAVYMNRLARVNAVTTGSGALKEPFIMLASGYPVYLRITYNGSGTWNGFVGDGYTFHRLFQKTGFSFTPKTMGFYLYQGNGSGGWVPQTVCIDWVRFTASVLNPYGG